LEKTSIRDSNPWNKQIFYTLWRLTMKISNMSIDVKGRIVYLLSKMDYSGQNDFGEVVREMLKTYISSIATLDTELMSRLITKLLLAEESNIHNSSWARHHSIGNHILVRLQLETLIPGLKYNTVKKPS
jgi:hypothetical protein